ncbi:alpha-amylase family protein [uncultured Bifidobacterium sp.]|uniref:alpha-amylase n=1 Tax=uncultured Bifidobacterium sp. TaxID=165187 RepID=UPI0028DD02A6|nr:alpha-amylase family protein [uncultured Bifidobacterium sp.]
MIVRTIRRVLSAALAVAAAVALALTTVQVPTGYASSFNPAAYRSDVIVTAFQWNWNSVARECTRTFGPEGVAYVQVSPPQESILGSQWWTSYQPVSYGLHSKEGTEAEFRSMVKQCRAAGVGIIADAVINHTTGVDKVSGTGTGGSTYTNTGDFPAIPYTAANFHDCDRDILSYTNATEVQTCRVSGLQDLDTSQPYVRRMLAAYFARLMRLGVAGFRVDAVKHIAADDVLAIKRLVAKDTGRSVDDIWWMQEVIGSVNEAEEIQPDRYLRSGQVSEFQYAYRLKRLFDDSLMGGTLTLDEISKSLVDSSKAAVFVTNWDTERNGSTLTYKDGSRYLLANAFMLAYPYSEPNVFSGYEFSSTDSGAPGATADSVPDVSCSTGSGWTCTQRLTAIRGMIGWHNVAGKAKLTDWQSDGDNVVAFGRGSKAFLVMNNGSSSSTATWRTSLPAGTYCDVYSSADCSTTVRVSASGSIHVSVPAGSAVAIHVGSRV